MKSRGFKDGDIVCLVHSAGPRMIAEKVYVGHSVKCVWFDKHNVLHVHEFPENILEKDEREPEPTNPSSLVEQLQG